jgi:hypothetical protein
MVKKVEAGGLVGPNTSLALLLLAAVASFRAS